MRYLTNPWVPVASLFGAITTDNQILALQGHRNLGTIPNPSCYPKNALRFFPIGFVAIINSAMTTMNQPVMPDDHSELVPPLPIPNRTVKRLCANDSAATSVKVGYRQAVIPKTPAT